MPRREVIQMQQIIGGLLYDTETAEEVASDQYWDGHNWERRGRNTYLYKTKKGNFFTCHTTLWQGERNYLDAIDVVVAQQLYEELPEHRMSYEEAFGVAPEEA
jgi:hypothetical protein